MRTQEELQDALKGFQKRLPIDGSRLGEECLQQAVLYDNIGQLVSELKRSARVAKDTMEFTEARLKKTARVDPGKFGIVKVTENAVEEAVKTHAEYCSAQKEHAEAQYLADCGNVLLTAAEQRKSMLKDAVSMSIHSLYSSTHDLSKDQKSLVGAQSHVNEEDINAIRRANAAARQVEDQQENTDV